MPFPWKQQSSVFWHLFLELLFAEYICNLQLWTPNLEQPVPQLTDACTSARMLAETQVMN